jgi:ferrochelatase
LPELNIQQPAGTADKVGVLLLNLGGPETLDDVEHFLFNLFNDPDIIRLPGQGMQQQWCLPLLLLSLLTCTSVIQLIVAALQLHCSLKAHAATDVLSSWLKQFWWPAAKFLQPLLAYTLSKLRAPKSSEGYKAIGGGSPLRRITDEQAAALSDALKRKGQNADVYVAMRYWYPFTEEALEKIKEDNVTRLVVLPLYPQFSISTSGSSLRLLEEVSYIRTATCLIWQSHDSMMWLCKARHNEAVGSAYTFVWLYTGVHALS